MPFGSVISPFNNGLRGDGSLNSGCIESALRLAIDGKTAEESLAKNTVRRDRRRVETLKQICRAIAAAGENLRTSQEMHEKSSIVRF